jgi:phage terminase large subunit-like protein
VNLTERQREAQLILAGDATHVMLFGGSRSGKTFLIVRAIVMRALKAAGSRHVALRFRFNAIKSSIVLDTFPKVMALAFPQVEYKLNKTDWYATFPGGSELWFGGLDDKERTEKILGMEFATLYLNECSQIPWGSQGVAVTRLAQRAVQVISDEKGQPMERALKPRAYYDCNPPPKSHWTYRLFIEKRDPETKRPLERQTDYASFQINPESNAENLSDGYLDTLRSLSARLQKRFLKGEFGDATPNQLFHEEHIDRWRESGRGTLPDFVRVVIAVDPSGSGDVDNADNDAIGIVVMALGTDGNAYLLEDCTVKAGPATWGRVVASAFDRHAANVVVGEANYGGAMVQHTIQTARPRTPYKAVHASRGKAVRAEPVAALYETGKIRHVGEFRELEDELAGFSTVGFIGENSPNRADAVIWAATELFPALTTGPQADEKKSSPFNYATEFA